VEDSIDQFVPTLVQLKLDAKQITLEVEGILSHRSLDGQDEWAVDAHWPLERRAHGLIAEESSGGGTCRQKRGVKAHETVTHLIARLIQVTDDAAQRVEGIQLLPKPGPIVGQAAVWEIRPKN